MTGWMAAILMVALVATACIPQDGRSAASTNTPGSSARQRLILAAVTTSGWQTFPDFACPRSGQGSDLVPTTAARLNAYLTAYR